MIDLFDELGLGYTPSRWDAERDDDFDTITDEDEDPDDLDYDDEDEPLY